ncbi:MAG: peptidase MA family metallohydrolase [Anaerolineales bacterium]|nr:peptidase MA family metallohydrolase [Anaerolineales bacterium]
MFNPRKFILQTIMVTLLAVTMSMKPEQVNGQGGIEVENPNVVINFGQTITFQARIKTPIPTRQVSLLFRGINEDVTRVETLQVAEDGSVSFTYDASLNIFPPFSWIVFWFQATRNDNITYTSAPTQFQYKDDRFPWRYNTQANITVNWYAGDDAFGAAAVDAAGAGMLAMNEILLISLSDPIEVYIYSNISDQQNTLLLGGEEWSGGHANPKLGVALVAIAPGPSQSIEMETKIPHELAHIMLYRSLGDKYARQPTWLIEGIASMVELYPNPDYARALDIASRNNSLLAFDDLCASFPADAGSAFLAYAQSQSFVTYIRNSFGTSGLGRLTNSYSDGFSCELDATNALGAPLSQLDVRWRESVLGQNVTGVAMRNLAPFVLLMVLVLVVPIWGAINMLSQRRKDGSQPK